jgi:hypothetical protein
VRQLHVVPYVSVPRVAAKVQRDNVIYASRHLVAVVAVAINSSQAQLANPSITLGHLWQCD